MKIAIMQPYFFPYIGYFQLINAVDKYVIYDDVQYIKGGWINRNYINLNGDRHLINLLLSGASANKNINEIFVLQNQIKTIKTIEHAYKKAPMFEKVFPLILDVINFENKNLGVFLGNSIIRISNYLSIDTEFLFSSQINKDNSKRSQDKVIDICKLLGATQYINAIGGKDLYEKSHFKLNGIELLFLETQTKPHIQYNHDYVPNLSIIDLMMFNDNKQIKKMLLDHILL